MRCKNCGWENPNGLTNCEKCNTPLDGAGNNGSSQGVAQDTPQVPNLSKTVGEADAFPMNDANVCPNCGYPMRPGVTDCPNCQHKVAAAPQPKQVVSSNGTVNPWVQVTPATKCSLEPVAQQGVETPALISLKGEAHELNRANLDPDNQTITSKVQAKLTFEDGKWYIQDQSAQHTTFIYAGNKTALSDGDVILMGNRQFVFRENK